MNANQLIDSLVCSFSFSDITLHNCSPNIALYLLNYKMKVNIS